MIGEPPRPRRQLTFEQALRFAEELVGRTVDVTVGVPHEGGVWPLAGFSGRVRETSPAFGNEYWFVWFEQTPPHAEHLVLNPSLFQGGRLDTDATFEEVMASPHLMISEPPPNTRTWFLTLDLAPGWTAKVTIY